MTDTDTNFLSRYVSGSPPDPHFHAVIDAHGVYNTQQFVLRLSSKIHRILSSLEPGIRQSGDADFETMRAMSTFLHETIHWWQHIGSTFGFIYSLVYPVQAHCTHFDLKKLVSEDGFKKSVFLQSIGLNGRGPGGFGTTAGLANIIVNNHFDLLAFRTFTYGPDAAVEVSQKQLFEAVGHAFRMTYAHIISTIGSTVDRDFNAIPHPKHWEEGFRDLTARKVKGFYYGSRVEIWPIGAHEIFEGQACFSQIQYLSYGCGHRRDWSDYRNLGFLFGVYVKAFQCFLDLTDSRWPDCVNDPLVSLFLLVCDLSLNPGSGFPFPVTPRFETFVSDVNPGTRFCFLCSMIRARFPAVKSAIKKHTRDEYEQISDELSASTLEAPPLLIAQRFSDWFSPSGPLRALRREFVTYRFESENYPIRHLFAHFLSFQEDKYLHPEFFCWPGVWMAGDLVDKRSQRLFDKHGALFVDKEDYDGVFPRVQSGRDAEVVHAAFDKFYHDSIAYDLTNQWISRPGPFDFNIKWITPDVTEAEGKAHLCRQFSAAYDLDLETVQILPEAGST